MYKPCLQLVVLAILSFYGCSSTLPFKIEKLNHSNNRTGTVFPVEKIYICLGYLEDFDLFYKKIYYFLKNKKAKKINNCWVINDAVNKKTYEIRILTDTTSVNNALTTEDSHVIIRGHANFGLGPVFFNEKKGGSKNKKDILKTVRYIDDDSLLNVSSKWIDLPISKLRINNRLINWWPEYQDGSSGIAAYDFSGAKAALPYNYYLTYQVPGDPNFYKIPDKKGRPIERFPLSGKEPWFSKEGFEPDASNPAHQKYFITNEENKNNFLIKYGNWEESRQPYGFYGENYFWKKQGTQENRAEWHFKIPFKGEYEIFSWWPTNKKNALNIKYSLKKNDTSKKSACQNFEMISNQKTNGNQWNKLGGIQLEAGNYILTQGNPGDDGITVADAIRIAHKKNPEDTFIPFFFSNKKKVKINEVVGFFSSSKGDIHRYKWDFGDGNTVITHKTYIFHQYKKPGIYDASLEIYDFQGRMLKKTKNRYLAVDSDEMPFQPEFSASPNKSGLPLKVRFTDQSRGGKIKRWYWNFGDGITSTEQNPEHTYRKCGNYTVSLTIIGNDKKIKKITKKKIIRASIFDTIIDNVNYPQTHYKNYTIIDGGRLKGRREKYRYKRLFFDSCSVKRYFLDTFNQGIVFYTTGVSNSNGLLVYLDCYLSGKKDAEILNEINKFQVNTYSVYDFNKKPE